MEPQTPTQATQDPQAAQAQTPTEVKLLSDIEIQRERQEFQKINDDLKGMLGGMQSRYRAAMRLLMLTEAFTERDLHLMMRGQILSPDFGGLPCEQTGDKYSTADDFETVERRRFRQSRYPDALDPVPVARHRLHCPLYERGLRGDPLVPCREAQLANPRVLDENLKEAPFLPADLSPVRREAINFFIERATEDLRPCKVVQALCQYELTRQIEAGRGPLYQIQRRPVPPPPPPPPERKDDLPLRRHLLSRQALLEARSQLEADHSQHQRELLRHLVQSGRLTHSDLISMTYEVTLVTDQGWLPCRDDPQRTHLEPVDLADSENEPDRSESLFVKPPREVCSMKVRALNGDTDVPCCEAQKVAPLPQRMAQIELRDQRSRAESLAFWEQRGGVPEGFYKPKVKPRLWASERDAPGGPDDIVKLLRVRPCYLLGHTIATYLYQFAQHLVEHPDPRPERTDDQGDGDDEADGDTGDDEADQDDASTD